MSTADSRIRVWTPVDTSPASSAAARQRVATALLLLALMQVSLFFGFGRFTQLLRAWPVRRLSRAVDPVAVAKETALAVNRACTYYPKHMRCLHRAAAIVCFLRWRGQEASLVIGIRKIPFAAHAWAELDGAVVNDRPGLRAEYSVIDTDSNRELHRTGGLNQKLIPSNRRPRATFFSLARTQAGEAVRF